MKETLLKMKKLFAGKWAGEGFAKFPTIDDTAYTEQLEFIPDEHKDAIFFRQKTWYKNNTEKNGHTVFWDTGFIILKDDKIVLHSVQVGGRMETYQLAETANETFTFNSDAILHDPKSTRSQRIFSVNGDNLHYELNMATHAADFQNHLKADLKRLF
jgi:nitrobindin-like protein